MNKMFKYKQCRPERLKQVEKNFYLLILSKHLWLFLAKIFLKMINKEHYTYI